MNVIPCQDIGDLRGDAGVGAEGVYIGKGGLNDNALLGKLAGIGKNDGPVGGICHIFHGFHPHKVVAGKAGVWNESVRTDEKLINKKLFGAFAHERSYHSLIFFLIFTAPVSYTHLTLPTKLEV